MWPTSDSWNSTRSSRLPSLRIHDHDIDLLGLALLVVHAAVLDCVVRSDSRRTQDLDLALGVLAIRYGLAGDDLGLALTTARHLSPRDDEEIRVSGSVPKALDATTPRRHRRGGHEVADHIVPALHDARDGRIVKDIGDALGAAGGGGGK